MPELPEVETYVRELAPELFGRQIIQAHVFWPRIIATPSAPEFVHAISGGRFTRFDRRGKYMLLGLSDNRKLIVHLRMTGKLHFVPVGAVPQKHVHVVLDLDDNRSIHYYDPRKFGRLWLTDDPESVLSHLGPEPLGASFTPQFLQDTLTGRRASIKALLLDQRILAGVGNIYADEALFRAEILPTRGGGTLSVAETERLHGAIREVLQSGIDQRGSSLGNSSLQNYVRPGGEQGGFQEEHYVFRRTGQPCYQCGNSIERTVLAQRSTHYCPVCQH